MSDGHVRTSLPPALEPVPDYLQDGVGCCAGCFCEHDPRVIADFKKMFRDHDEMAARIKSEADYVRAQHEEKL